VTSRKPPSRRDVEYAPQHLARWTQSTFIGTLGGRWASARPWSERGSLAEQGLGPMEDLAHTGYEPYNDDIYDLDSDGAQDLELTFLPVDGSEDIKLNGIGLRKYEQWSRDGRTLSILTAAGALTDDVVTTEYWYATGEPDVAPDEELLLNVPYGSSGWRYNNDLGDASWYSTGFSDSGWSVGTGVLHHTGATLPYTAPFTDGTTTLPGSEEGLGTDVGSAVPEGGLGIEGNLWVRRWFPPGDDIVVKVDANNYVEFYVDGASVGSRSTSARAVSGYGPFDKTAPWLLAVHAYCGAGQTWAALDVEVTGTVL
jgi:hypothetical protein